MARKQSLSTKMACLCPLANDLGFAKDGKRAVVFIAPYEGERPPDIRQAIDRAILKAEDGIEKVFVKELEK